MKTIIDIKLLNKRVLNFIDLKCYIHRIYLINNNNHSRDSLVAYKMIDPGANESTPRCQSYFLKFKCPIFRVTLPNDVLHLSANLNVGQNRTFTIVISSLLGNQPQRRMLMLHGEGGSGKSYLYQRISDACLILVNK
jgi:hypothetical protein